MLYTNGYNSGYHNRNYGERLDSYTDVRCEADNNYSLNNRRTSASWAADSNSRREFAPGRNTVSSSDGVYYKSFVSAIDLNSPESYDSGIQDDTSDPRSYNMYAVVKKSKRKLSSNGDLQMSPGSDEDHVSTNGFRYGGNTTYQYGYEEPGSSSNSLPHQNRRKLSPMLECRNDEDDEYDDAFEENERQGVGQPVWSSSCDDDGPYLHSTCRVQHKIPLHQGRISENEDNQNRSNTLENRKRNQRLNSENVRRTASQNERKSQTERTTISQNERATSQNERIASQNERRTSQNERTPSQNERTTSFSSRLPISTESTSYIETFEVSLLGSLPLTEDDLSEERNVASINRCMLAFSQHIDKKQHKKRFSVSMSMCLQIIGEQLELSDAKTEAVIRTHSVKSIRNWGIGKEKNSTMFAYVVREKTENEYTCWVFLTKTSAQRIVMALREVCCKGVAKQKNLSSTKDVETLFQTNQQKFQIDKQKFQMDQQKFEMDQKRFEMNQQKFQMDQQKFQMDQQKCQNNNQETSNSPPVPMLMTDSPNTFCCRYLGLMKVPKAFGMDVLNNAMEVLCKSIPPSDWLVVDVEVSSAVIVVVDHQNPNSIVFDCRIRYLTFLGIAVNNARLGAFIMHTADDEFLAHVFHCEPSASVFSRLITAACNLRYQKCLDARAQRKKETITNNTDFRKVNLQKGQQADSLA